MTGNFQNMETTTENDRENIRNEVLNMMNDKEAIEKKIGELTLLLEQQGVTLTSPLVDQEGYPLNNVDLYLIKNTRQRINCLQNDHKALMKQIEKGLHDYYGITTSCSDARPSQSEETDKKRPFAKITVVSEHSPAAQAGLNVGDEVVEFGSVNVDNFKSLTDIAAVVQHSQGSEVNVTIQRGGSVLKTRLVPRKWQGQGLLGCNINALE